MAKEKYNVGDEKSMKKLAEVLERSKTRLSIARIDKKTREDFINLARDRFCDDFGMALQWALYQSLEYQTMKEKLIDLGSINARLAALEETVISLQSPKKMIKTIGGKVIKR